MDNFSLFYATCDRFVNKPTYRDTSTDEALATADIKVLDEGFIKLCFKQLIDKPNNIFFFIFFIVQSSNPGRLNFVNNYWENDPSIERIISVSGDFGSSVHVAMKKAVPDDFQKQYMTTRRVIVSPTSQDAVLYSSNDPPDTVSVNKVLSLLESLDINGLFSGSLKDIKKQSNL